MLGTCPTYLNSRSSKAFYRGQCGRNVLLNALRAAVACRNCILSSAGHTVLYRANLSLTAKPIGRRMLGTCPTYLNSRSSKAFYRGQRGRNASLNALQAAVACRMCILSFAGHTVMYRAKLNLTVLLAADFLIDYKNSLVFSLSKRPRRPFLPRPYPFPDTKNAPIRRS